MLKPELNHAMHDSQRFHGASTATLEEDDITTMDRLDSFIDGAVHAAGSVRSFFGESVETAKFCGALAYMALTAGIEKTVKLHDSLVYRGNVPEGYRDGVDGLLRTINESDVGRKAEEKLGEYLAPI